MRMEARYQNRMGKPEAEGSIAGIEDTLDTRVIGKQSGTQKDLVIPDLCVSHLDQNGSGKGSTGSTPDRIYQ